MLEYMKGQGGEFADAASAFAQATGLEDSTGNEGFRGLLEKKWTSVVRLQRKVSTTAVTATRFTSTAAIDCATAGWYLSYICT